MSTTHAPTTDATILSRVIAPEIASLSPAVAREILRWGFTSDDQSRMAELAAKAREGSLTEMERAELDEYEHVSSFLGLLKSKARRSLANGSPE